MFCRFRITTHALNVYNWIDIVKLQSVARFELKHAYGTGNNNIINDKI